jgi:hypothetical protein
VICVITSCLGGFDNLRPPLGIEPNDETRWICYTDQVNIPACPPWDFRPIPHLLSAARASRIPKILPHLVLPAETDYSIWHDANFQLTMSPRATIGELLRFDDWAAHKHPARDCIYREADILLKEKIGTPTLIEAEIARYRAAGYPEANGYGTGAGLWANGLLVRRHTPAVAAVNERWWDFYAAGCERDQISFPVARRELGLSVNTIQNDIFHSPYMRFQWHAAWRDKQDNPSYWISRDRQRTQLRRLEALTGARCPYHEY